MSHHSWKFVSLILLGCFIFLWLIKAPILSVYLTEKMGVQVTARTISVWPGESTIRHFRIANPPGFHSPTAFEVVKTHISFVSLFSNPLIINEIVLDGIRLNIEIRNKAASDNNWAAIGAHLPKTSKGKSIIIHKLILKNMTVVTTGKGAVKLGVAGTQHFDHMEFDEINSEHGFPTKDLVSQIFKGAGLMKYLENFLNPTQRIKDTLNPFNIFGLNSELDISE